MIDDFDDLCTWMYVLVSDLLAPLPRRSPVLVPRSPAPTPS